jgi:hypothetical protein
MVLVIQPGRPVDIIRGAVHQRHGSVKNGANAIKGQPDELKWARGPTSKSAHKAHLSTICAAFEGLEG